MNNFEYISRGRVYKVNHFRTIQFLTEGVPSEAYPETTSRLSELSNRIIGLFNRIILLSNRTIR